MPHCANRLRVCDDDRTETPTRNASDPWGASGTLARSQNSPTGKGSDGAYSLDSGRAASASTGLRRWKQRPLVLLCVHNTLPQATMVPRSRPKGRPLSLGGRKWASWRAHLDLGLGVDVGDVRSNTRGPGDIEERELANVGVLPRVPNAWDQPERCRGRIRH